VTSTPLYYRAWARSTQRLRAWVYTERFREIKMSETAFREI